MVLKLGWTWKNLTSLFLSPFRWYSDREKKAQPKKTKWKMSILQSSPIHVVSFSIVIGGMARTHKIDATRTGLDEYLRGFYVVSKFYKFFTSCFYFLLLFLKNKKTKLTVSKYKNKAVFMH